MKKVFNYWFLLWPCFIICLIGVIVALLGCFQWSIEYGVKGPIPPQIYETQYAWSFWLLMPSTLISSLSASLLFVYRLGDCVFEEEYSDKDVERIKGLMKDKGFTFTEAIEAFDADEKKV